MHRASSGRGGSGLGLMIGSPRSGSQFRILSGLHSEHSGEQALDILEWVDAGPPAGFHYREADRASLPGLGGPDEEPVLLADRSRSDRVLDLVVVCLDAAVQNV